MNKIPEEIRRQVLLAFTAANTPLFLIRKLISTNTAQALKSRLTLEQLLEIVVSTDVNNRVTIAQQAYAYAALIALLIDGDPIVFNSLKEREYKNLKWAPQVVQGMQNRAYVSSNGVISDLQATYTLNKNLEITPAAATTSLLLKVE